MNKGCWSIAVVVLGVLVGCGDNSKVAENPETHSADNNETAVDGNATSVVSPTATHDSSPAQLAPVAADASPEQVVIAFLDSLRQGNDDHAAALLTALAREDTAREGFTVRLQGSPTASYEVGSARYVSELKDRAHVSCLCKETDSNDYTEEFEVIWLLKRQPNVGWRIWGMQDQGPDGPHTVYNFEDARDMKAKLAMDIEPGDESEHQARGGADAAPPNELR